MQASTSDQRFDRVVGLGYSCQTAHQIRRITGDETAYPLDWVVTYNTGLLTCIANDFDGFFDVEQLHRPTDGASVTHAVTDMEFPHEFSADADVVAEHANHAGRYAAVGRRWVDLMDGTDSLLFVREDRSTEDIPRAAEALRVALAARLTHQRFHLLYLTNRPADAADWGLDGITNGYLSQLDPYEWQGDDRQWTRLLADFDIPRVAATASASSR
ncbi:MAG: DUF1796 family putative cysteine peptidase [Actinomycetes bacterium]